MVNAYIAIAWWSGAGGKPYLRAQAGFRASAKLVGEIKLNTTAEGLFGFVSIILYNSQRN